MKIAVIGAGFVGLTTALGLCSKGHKVICVDSEKERVKQIEKGKIPFFEPGLENLLYQHSVDKNFIVTSDIEMAVASSEVSIICVGTPTSEDGIDLKFVKLAAVQVANNISSADFHVIVIKSTVVPGSVDTEIQQFIEKSTGKISGCDFGLAMNPEFLREGNAVEDFLNPDRIVIGSSETITSEILQKLYAGFNCPILLTSTRNAEMIKYASNALLASLISFANEMSTICESTTGLSEEIVMNGVFEDRRFWCLSKNQHEERLRPDLVSYLRGGIGFGGSCFPKDVKALLKFSESTGLSSPLLKAVLDVNKQRTRDIVEKFISYYDQPIVGKKITVLGLSFKPDTDDIRHSPAISIINLLSEYGIELTVHDPKVGAQIIRQNIDIPNLKIAKSIEEALKGSDGALITTSWNCYKETNWSKLTQTMKDPYIYDGRQVIPESQQGKGFSYLKSGNSSILNPRNL